MKTLEQKAREFATIAHEGQFRKDGKTPYITHPAGVVGLLKEVGVTNEDVICSGWLHDVIEDCNTSRQTLEKEFNSNIARIVAILTRDIGRDAYNERIRNSDYAVQIVKLADFVHNCSQINSIGISKDMINKKIKDSKSLYFELAKSICFPFYELLHRYLDPIIEENSRRGEI